MNFCQAIASSAKSIETFTTRFGATWFALTDSCGTISVHETRTEAEDAMAGKAAAATPMVVFG